jgi:hypothetical protein
VVFSDQDALLPPSGRTKQQQVVAQLWLWAESYLHAAKHPAR